MFPINCSYRVLKISKIHIRNFFLKIFYFQLIFLFNNIICHLFFEMTSSAYRTKNNINNDIKYQTVVSSSYQNSFSYTLIYH